MLLVKILFGIIQYFCISLNVRGRQLSARDEYEGQVLKSYSLAGNARHDIVADDRDRTALLDLLVQVMNRYGWVCHASCLMDNHYHLFLETSQPNLSLGMRQLNGCYTQAFN